MRFMNKQAYRATIVIPVAKAKHIVHLLERVPSNAEECMNEDETITFTADFPEGMAVDVKVCGVQYREGEDNRPWTEAVLFKNGSEVCCTEPGENFFGEWVLEDGENKYIVTICREGFACNVALWEKPHDEGLKLSEVTELYQMLPDGTEAVPVEFQGEYSTAMGFIDIETADRMDYIYTELEEYVKEILNDMDMESPDGRYMFAHGGETVSLLIKR